MPKTERAEQTVTHLSGLAFFDPGQALIGFVARWDSPAP
jgi:hypothetical protein